MKLGNGRQKIKKINKTEWKSENLLNVVMEIVSRIYDRVYFMALIWQLCQK